MSSFSLLRSTKDAVKDWTDRLRVFEPYYLVRQGEFSVLEKAWNFQEFPFILSQFCKLVQFLQMFHTRERLSPEKKARPKFCDVISTCSLQTFLHKNLGYSINFELRVIDGCLLPCKQSNETRSEIGCSHVGPIGLDGCRYQRTIRSGFSTAN